MTLPERQSQTLPSLAGQAALFEDSNRLLALTDAELRHVAASYGSQAQGGLALMRRNMGLLAWAGWLRFEGKPYEQFVVALSEYVGVAPRTVKAWRDDVIQKDSLSVPPATDQRREEAKAREKRGRSKQVRAENQHEKIIPATSKPVEEPEGVPEDSPAPLDAPSGPNPERLPSLREETSTVFATVMNATEGFGAKFSPEEATAYDNRHKREMAAFRKAYGIDQTKPEGRQGYSRAAVPRPAGVSARTVPPPRLPAKASVGKSHADDCHCYGCQPPKVAKG